MAFKVVAESSSNLLSLKDTDFVSVPLTIVAGNAEFVDNRDLCAYYAEMGGVLVGLRDNLFTQKCISRTG